MFFAVSIGAAFAYLAMLVSSFNPDYAPAFPCEVVYFNTLSANSDTFFYLAMSPI
jgi:hypothetical protein